MLKWDKPKASIRKIVLVFSFVMSLISVVGVGTFYVLFFQAAIVNKIDSKLTAIHIHTIRNNYEKSLSFHREGRPKNALDYLARSYDDLKSIGKVDKHYEFKRVVMRRLVNSYIKKNRYDQALEVINVWKENDDRDIEAQLLFLSVLGLKGGSHDFVLEEYESLLNEFYGVEEVAFNYINYCLDRGLVERAGRVNDVFISAQKRKESHYLKDVLFKIYYIDNVNGKITSYSEGQSESSSPTAIADSALQYVEINKQFVHFEGLRLDLETIFKEKEYYLDNFSIVIESTDGKFVLGETDIARMNSINSDKGKFLVQGNDPYMMFKIPAELLSYRGELKARFIFDFGLEIRDLIEK